MGMRKEKVNRRRSMGSTIALIFLTKDSNKAVRSVEGEGGGIKEGKGRLGFLGAALE